MVRLEDEATQLKEHLKATEDLKQEHNLNFKALSKFQTANTILQEKFDKISLLNNEYLSENKFLNNTLNQLTTEKNQLSLKINSENHKYKVLNDELSKTIAEKDNLTEGYQKEIISYKKEIDFLKREVAELSSNQKQMDNFMTEQSERPECNFEFLSPELVLKDPKNLKLNKNTTCSLFKEKSSNDSIVVENAMKNLNSIDNSKMRNSYFKNKLQINIDKQYSPVKQNSPLKTTKNIDMKASSLKRNFNEEIKNLIGEKLTNKILINVNKNRQKELTSLNDLLSADEEELNNFVLDEDEYSNNEKDLRKQGSQTKLKKEKISFKTDHMPRIVLSSNSHFNFYQTSTSVTNNLEIASDISFEIIPEKSVSNNCKVESKHFQKFDYLKKYTQRNKGKGISTNDSFNSQDCSRMTISSAIVEEKGTTNLDKNDEIKRENIITIEKDKVTDTCSLV